MASAGFLVGYLYNSGLLGPTEYKFIIWFRTIAGVCVGITSMAVPTYIAETAPTSIRGALGAMNQFGLVCGMLFVNVFGYFVQPVTQSIIECAEDAPCENIDASWTCNIDAGSCEGAMSPWHTIMLIAAVIASFTLVVGNLVLPKTPTFLASKGKLDEAKAVLERLRDTPKEVETDMADFTASTSGAGGDGHKMPCFQS